MIVEPSNPSERGDVERLAYQLWIERGSPLGSPEIDWYQAEKLFRESSNGETKLSVLAKEIGAMVGQVVSLRRIGNPPGR